MKTTTWRLCNRWYVRARSQIVLKHVSANRRRFALIYLYLQTEVSFSHAPSREIEVPWDDWYWRSRENCCLHLQVKLYFPQDFFLHCVPSFLSCCFHWNSSLHILLFSFISLLKNCGILSSFTFQTFHIHPILLFNNLPYTVLISNSLLYRFLSYFSLPIYITKQHSVPKNLKIGLISFSQKRYNAHKLT